MRRDGSTDPKHRDVARGSKSLLVAVGGYLVLSLPVFAYLAANHALRDLWYQCFTFTRLYYRSARKMPFPLDPWRHPVELVFYLPIAVPIVALLYAGWRVLTRRGRGSETGLPLIFPLSVLALLYAAKGSVRVDFGQMLPANFAVAILLGVLLCRNHPAAVRRFAAVVMCVALTVISLDVKALLRPVQKQGELAGLTFPGGASRADVPGWCGASSPLSAPFCFGMDADHERAGMYLLQRVRPADRLYVGLSRHDKIFAGDNLTYFATGTLPAVKWSHFDPDLETRADIQAEMIASLTSFKPQFATQTSQYDQADEPNDSSVSSGVTLLDDYLLQNYQPVATFGVVTVLERRAGK